MGADERVTSPVALVTGANRGIGCEMRLVHVVCPGFVAISPEAEAAGGSTPPEGAASMVFPDDGPTGGFFRDGKPLYW